MMKSGSAWLGIVSTCLKLETEPFMARSNHYRPELLLKDNLQKLKSQPTKSESVTLIAHKPDYSTPPEQLKIGYPNGERLSTLFESVREAIGAREAITRKENNNEHVGKRLLAAAANLDIKKAKLKKKFTPVIADVLLYLLLDEKEKEPYSSAWDWFDHWQGYHLKKFSSYGFNDLLDTLMQETIDESIADFQKNNPAETTAKNEKD